MGYRTTLNLKAIISIVSFKQNMNLKIQNLVGNMLMSRFHVSFEIELPLVRSIQRPFLRLDIFALIFRNAVCGKLSGKKLTTVFKTISVQQPQPSKKYTYILILLALKIIII